MVASRRLDAEVLVKYILENLSYYKKIHGSRTKTDDWNIYSEIRSIFVNKIIGLTFAELQIDKYRSTRFKLKFSVIASTINPKSMLAAITCLLLLLPTARLSK